MSDGKETERSETKAGQRHRLISYKGMEIFLDFATGTSGFFPEKRAHFGRKATLNVMDFRRVPRNAYHVARLITEKGFATFMRGRRYTYSSLFPNQADWVNQFFIGKSFFN
jgi:hypothetical protein